jgi:uroporphyrinogen decarboxylase
MNMNDSNFIKACRGEVVDQIPVWFMRQAGRSLPGYRKLRETYGVLELTNTSELAAQVSMEPIELLGVDAAILFADIMLLPIALGVNVKIVDSVGPIIDEPIDTPDKINRLQPFTPDKIAFLAETIRILRAELRVPVIGFSGAPFTLASYLIEGKPSRTWQKTKRFMLEEPEAWHRLMSILADATVQYLQVQIRAGANAVQLFDSWVGCLSPQQYRTYVQPHVRHIFASLKSADVPRLHFATNTAGMLTEFADVDCDVVGVDWRMSLTYARERIGSKTLQGNLDPAMVLTPWNEISKTIDSMVSEIDAKKGYIFNLGHGVLPESDDAVLRKIVSYVHEK